MIDTSTPILHVDMDAFYASVALRDRPELRDVPVIVGGGYRGVVLCANYAARRFGVRSAMPSVRARRLCPDLVAVSGDHEEFARVSTAVIEIFRRFTPVLEVVSQDEAFLDVRGAVRLLGAPRAIAERVRSTIYDEQRITCSVGIAASVSVAKLASRKAKPDGVVEVPPDQAAAFLHPLDVGDLYGVGDKTGARLRRLGLLTVGDVAHLPIPTLCSMVGDRLAHHLHALSWGTDRTCLNERRGPAEPDRSMGAQETFGRDVEDRGHLVRELLRLSGRVAGRMRSAGLAGRTVTLTVRFTDFTTITRSRTLPEATDGTQQVYRTAVALLDALSLGPTRVRLVGVRVEGLRPRAGVHHQHELGERDHGWADADRAVDAATRRFGRGIVAPASLLGEADRRPSDASGSASERSGAASQHPGATQGETIYRERLVSRARPA